MKIVTLPKARNIFLLIVLAFTTSCGSSDNEIVIKIYQNQNWPAWNAARYGLPYVPEKQVASNCEEFVQERNPEFLDTYKRNSGATDGIMKLQEVNMGGIIDEYSLVQVAKISVTQQSSDQLTLQEVWNLVGANNLWNHPSIQVINTENDCSMPRTLIGGDILEMPNQKRYVIDEAGFEELQPIIPAKTILMGN